MNHETMAISVTTTLGFLYVIILVWRFERLVQGLAVIHTLCSCTWSSRE